MTRQTVDPYGLRSARQPDLAPEFIRRIPPRDDNSIAIFDADGTLWTGDVADDFTQWMIGQGAVPGERWPTYMRIYRDDPPTGCEFLLTFYTGMTPEVLADQSFSLLSAASLISAAFLTVASWPLMRMPSATYWVIDSVWPLRLK